MAFRSLALYLLPLLVLLPASAQPTEEDYYRIVTLPIPEGVVLEVAGLTLLPDGSLAASTRRGEVWTIQNPYVGDGVSRPHFTRFAHGLHEPLGLLYHDNSLYAAQRGELTRLIDRNGDGAADHYESVYRWPLSGNYHEYSYGPILREDGTMIVTLNVAWEGKGTSPVPWRGWTVEISPDGEMTPFAAGMRSPAGFGLTSSGDLFFAENQGDWVGSGYITHVERGDFAGHVASLAWTDLPGSPLTLGVEDVPDTGLPRHVVAESLPAMKLPSVWFPHGLMGISTSDILEDSTGGGFGPFEGQLFVGDQGHSRIMRVALEQVEGVYQGAVFGFREGFASGVLRLQWGKDGSMFVGQTSRGWSATGSDPYALQRVIWTGAMPFEPLAIHARPDGFEITFTQPVDPATAGDPASYEITGFTYQYHENYGSPIIEQEDAPIRQIVVADDGLSARLVVDDLREGYIHEVKMEGVRNEAGLPLLHNVGYYTLNRLPDGPTLAETGTPPVPQPTPRVPQATVAATAPTPSTPPAETAAQPKKLTTMPASWTNGPDATLSVGTVPGLKFDIETLQVKAGSKVRLVFNNADDMLHNLLIVQPGAATEVGEQAIALGLDGPAKEYVPDGDLVLYHTSLLEPEESESIYFVAPTEPGEYMYVCTFPGHYLTMRGVLRVVP